jgi:hypothetical protein
MTAKTDTSRQAEQPLVNEYSEVGSAALRAALLCLRKAAPAKPSTGSKAA